MNALIVVFLLILDYPGIIRFEARLSGFEEDYPVWIIRAHPGGNRIIKTAGPVLHFLDLAFEFSMHFRGSSRTQF